MDVCRISFDISRVNCTISKRQKGRQIGIWAVWERTRRLLPRTPYTCDRIRNISTTQEAPWDAIGLPACLPHAHGITPQPASLPDGDTPQLTSTGRRLHCDTALPPASKFLSRPFDLRMHIHRYSALGPSSKRIWRNIRVSPSSC